MPDERSQELAQRLRKAEEAASYMERLENLASEAPSLREQVTLLQRREERNLYRQDALERARQAVLAASEAQQNLPELISTSSELVNQLARMLREVDTFLREANTSLGVVDRMDYEDELDEALEYENDEEAPVQRDAQSIKMLVASRHGSTRVRQMMDAISPGFHLFAGCDLDAVPMRRELTNLIMAKLAAEAESNRPQQRRPAPPPRPQVSEPITSAPQDVPEPAIE